MSIYLVVTAHPRTTQNSRQRHTTTNMGTSYRPISLLSVVAKTLEKCLLPYITANITQTPTQHGHKAQHQMMLTPKHITIANVYIPRRDSTSTNYTKQPTKTYNNKYGYFL